MSGLFAGRLEDLALPEAGDLEPPSADEIRDMPSGQRRYFRVLMLVTIGIERATGPLESFAEWAWLAAVEAAKLKPLMAKYARSMQRPFGVEAGSEDLRVVAKQLAMAHRDADAELTRVLMVTPSKHDDEIRLLEVTGSVGTTHEILPFTFAPQPDKGWNFAMSVILVSQEEYDDLQAGELDLPDDWGSVDDLEDVRVDDGEERRGQD